ncbi:MAG: LPS export ABC transporter permease LptG [Nitrospina sp.]|nr:LPS export ABC transporter permease LptG [Nitrospina sp.]
MILKRYVLKQFLQIYLLTLGALVGMFLVIDCFERIDEFVSRSAPLSYLFFYYVYKVPFIFFFMAPQAVLLATVVTLATLARNNEFTAMKACGIGVTRITLPILSCSIVIAFFVVIINEFVAPVTSEKMNYIYYVKVRGMEEQGQLQRDNIWLRSANGAIWNISFYDPGKSLMRGASLLYYDEEELFMRRRIDAEQVLWNGKQWEFLKGSIRYFGKESLDKTEFFEKEFFPVLETPTDFQKIQKRPEELSLREMYGIIQANETEGLDTHQIWVDLHQKLSYPFVSVVLALIGIPLSIRSSRNGGILFCVAVSLSMGFVFSFLYAMGISLGHGGTFNPILATWGPCFLFVCIGLYLLLTMDSDRLLPI